MNAAPRIWLRAGTPTLALVGCDMDELKDLLQLPRPARVSENGARQGHDMVQPAYQPAQASFFKDAAAAGMAELAAGKLAGRQASSDKVRGFARQMVDDHILAGQQLQSLAQQKNVTLPQSPDVEHQQTLAELEQKKDADFDKAYIAAQVQDHRKAVALFEEAAQAQDRDVAAFAQKMLPTLRHHLQMAESLVAAGG